MRKFKLNILDLEAITNIFTNNLLRLSSCNLFFGIGAFHKRLIFLNSYKYWIFAFHLIFHTHCDWLYDWTRGGKARMNEQAHCCEILWKLRICDFRIAVNSTKLCKCYYCVIINFQWAYLMCFEGMDITQIITAVIIMDRRQVRRQRAWKKIKSHSTYTN